jgi:hypothetical protein
MARFPTVILGFFRKQAVYRENIQSVRLWGSNWDHKEREIAIGWDWRGGTPVLRPVAP